VNYHLGVSLGVVLTAFLIIVVVSVVTFRVAWGSAVGEIERSAAAWKTVSQ